MIFKKLAIPNQADQLLRVGKIQPLTALLLVAGLCDGTDSHAGALILLLQSLLSDGSVIVRLVEQHALEVEPDAMAEKEASRGGHDDQIHEPLGVLRVPSQVERAQLGDEKL